MEPARAELAEDLIPVDVAGFKLGNSRVPPVRATESRAGTKTALREVQSVSHAAAHTVIIHPLHLPLINAALVEKILEQSPHWIVSNCGDDGRIEAKATLQPASYVVFASALGDRKGPSRGNAVIPRIKTQHHLAQTDQVPAMSRFWFDIQRHCDSRSYAPSAAASLAGSIRGASTWMSARAIKYTEPAMMKIGT